MKVKIKNLTINNNVKEESLLDLINETGMTCISQACLDKNMIGILINTGIYKEDHCMEPAYASLIQESLSINSSLSEAHTFSFDLMNGSNGIFNAIEVIESLMETHQINYAMIISFDLSKTSKEHLSAAMILENDLSDRGGFGKIQFTSYTDYLEHDKTYLDLDDNKLIQNKDKSLDEIIPELIKDAFTNYLEKNKKTANEYKYLILSHLKPVQQKSFLIDFGIDSRTTVIFQDISNNYSQTIEPFKVLNKFIEDKKLQKNDKICFIQLGSGLIINCAEYQY